VQRLLIFLVLFALVGILSAQTTDTVAVYAGVNTQQSDHVIPGFAWLHSMINTHTSNFVGFEVVGLQRHPLTAQTVMTEGVCESTQVFSLAFTMGACGGAGAAEYAGATNHVGAAATGLPFVSYSFGKSHEWGVYFAGGVLKTTIDTLSTPMYAGVSYSFGATKQGIHALWQRGKKKKT